MALVGTKVGSYQAQVQCGGLSASKTITPSGSSNPVYGLTAPASLIGTIGTNGSSSCTLVLGDSGASVTSAVKVAVFWLSGGVLQACYDLAVASNSLSGGTNTVTITQSTGVPTSGSFYAAGGSAPSALPANGTTITVAIAQDMTQALEGVTIPGGTGAYIQQLMATSTQPGLIEWLKASGQTQERLSALLVAGDYDTWPTASSQVGSLPTGGAGNNWTSGDTCTLIRCYNLGSSIANVGVSSVPATMQASVILA